jgi:hypothetical protein
MTTAQQAIAWTLEAFAAQHPVFDGAVRLSMRTLLITAHEALLYYTWVRDTYPLLELIVQDAAVAALPDAIHVTVVYYVAAIPRAPARFRRGAPRSRCARGYT